MAALALTRSTLPWRTAAADAADPSGYGAGSGRARATALATTLAAHLAAGLFLLWHVSSPPGTGLDPTGAGRLSVFSVAEVAADSVVPVDVPVLPPPPKTVPVSEPALLPEPPLTTASGVADGDPAAAPAAGGNPVSDPFALAGLTGRFADDSTSPPGATPLVRSTLPDLDQALFAMILKRFRDTAPAVTGTVLIRCTILPDGRVADARYLGGSVNEAAVAGLVRLLVGQRPYPPVTGTGMRVAMLGPIPLSAATGAAS